MITEELWRHVRATQDDRATTLPPPRATDVWKDLTAARMEAHTQSLEIGDLREAVSYLAGVVEGLKTRLENLERGTQ